MVKLDLQLGQIEVLDVHRLAGDAGSLDEGAVLVDDIDDGGDLAGVGHHGHTTDLDELLVNLQKLKQQINASDGEISDADNTCTVTS